MNYKMGDYTNCYAEIAEIVDEFDEVVCTVSQSDVDFIIGILNENEQLKYGKFGSKFEMGDYTVCRYDIADIIDEDDDICYDVICTVATDDVDVVIEILKENEELKKAQ